MQESVNSSYTSIATAGYAVAFLFFLMFVKTCFCINIQLVLHIYAKWAPFQAFLNFAGFTYLYKTFVKIITIASIFAFFSFTFKSWYFSFAKPWVLHPKTLGFTSWNPWFCNLKPMLSDCNLMPFAAQFQFCIFMQKQPHPQPLPVGEGSE